MNSCKRHPNGGYWEVCGVVAEVPTTAAGRFHVIMELLAPRYVDEDGNERVGEPLISREDAMEMLLWPYYPATIGPENIDANGAPV